MSVGSILGGIGSILGAGAGIAGMFGGGNLGEGRGAKKAKHHQLDYDRRRIAALVNGAKDAGIHPLAVLGAASGSGGFASPVSSGSGFNVGDAIGLGGNALRDIASLYESDQDRIERAQDRTDRLDQVERARMDKIAEDTIASGQRDMQNKVHQAEIDRLNSETMLNQAQSRSIIAGMRNKGVGATPPVRKFNTGIFGDFELRPGASPASDTQDVGGEPFEWLTALDTLIYRLEKEMPWLKRKPGDDIKKWLGKPWPQGTAPHR